MDKSDSIKEALDAGAFDDSPARKAEVERYYQAFQDAIAMIESEIVNINAKVNIVDDNTYKNKIKQLFVGQGLDWNTAPEYQNYIDRLSTNELRKVNQGIEDKSIKNWSDLTNAVDNYRKSLEETIEVEQNSPNNINACQSAFDEFILHIIKDINFNMINVLLVFKIIIIVIASRLPCVPAVGTSVHCLTCTDWSPKEIYSSCSGGYVS